MADKKLPLEEKKELVKDEELEKVSGGTIEYDKVYFTNGPSNYVTALDQPPSGIKNDTTNNK